MKCGSGYLDHQPFPERGPLVERANRPLTELRNRLGPDRGLLYAYIIRTIKLADGQFVQKGTAPNFQGGYITLCTCKHRMRTFLDCGAWKGKWIAGFTGVAAGGGRNALVYLMSVLHAFPSHRDLWFSDKIPQGTKQAKVARDHKYGDVYKPRCEDGDPLAPRTYFPPCAEHAHRPDKDQLKDVGYTGSRGRPAALLVGDPAYSFTWSSPMLFSRTQLYRGQKKWSLQECLDDLENGR